MSRYGLLTMFEAVFRALNERGVRYLVAGGVTVPRDLLDITELERIRELQGEP